MITQTLDTHVLQVLSSLVNLAGMDNVRGSLQRIERNVMEQLKAARSKAVAASREDIRGQLAKGRARRVAALGLNTFVFGKLADGQEFCQHVHEWPEAIREKAMAIRLGPSAELEVSPGNLVTISEAYDEVMPEVRDARAIQRARKAKKR